MCNVIIENCGEYRYLCLLIFFFWMIFFIGNDDIHLLTTATKQELRVDVQMFSGKKNTQNTPRFLWQVRLINTS